MNLKSILILFAVVLLTINCSKKEEEQKSDDTQEDVKANVHKVVVDEVAQATQYTYLKVKENEEEYWIAVTRREAEVGDEYIYSQALEMKDFESRELGKTFDRILFVDQLNVHGDASTMMGSAADGMQGKKPVLSKEDVSIDPVSDGVTIAELYKNYDKYGNKKIKIRGKVTKVNNQIMGRNWVHIQDGTGDKNSFDLTVTTDESINEGDIVTLEGVIAIDKDFGAGYAYKIIMEEAKKL